jgi:hypothetical protein
MPSENMPSPCDLGAMKVPRPATPIATSAFPPTSHGTGLPLMTWLVFVFVVLPCCTEAVGVGWRWGTRGGSCTSACASVQQACIQVEFLKVKDLYPSRVNFNAVKGVGVDCGQWDSRSLNFAPFRTDYSSVDWSRCHDQSGTGPGGVNSPTCAATPWSGDYYRVCPCVCPANTISLPLQPWPCPR